MNERELQDVRRLLTELVSAQGRDDIAVGEVSEVNGTIRFTLNRGHFTHADEIPFDVLRDKEEAKRRMTSVIFKLSKQVEREHIANATQ